MIGLFNDFDEFSNYWLTLSRIKEVYKLKDSEEEPKEYTLEEIAKALGIDVQNLRIKE
jgi:hypothetical protein